MILTPPAFGREVIFFSMFSKTIALESNASTGYRWAVESSDGLSYCEEYVIDKPVMPGKPGRQVFTFMSEKGGEFTVKIVYGRPWEESPIDSYTETFVLG